MADSRQVIDTIRGDNPEATQGMSDEEIISEYMQAASQAQQPATRDRTLMQNILQGGTEMLGSGISKATGGYVSPEFASGALGLFIPQDETDLALMALTSVIPGAGPLAARGGRVAFQGAKRMLGRTALATAGGGVAGSIQAGLEGGDISEGATQGAIRGGVAQGVGEVAGKAAQVTKRIRAGTRGVPGDKEAIGTAFGEASGLSQRPQTANELIKFAEKSGPKEASRRMQGTVDLINRSVGGEQIGVQSVPSLYKAYGLDPKKEISVKEAIEKFQEIGFSAFKEGKLRGTTSSAQAARFRKEASGELRESLNALSRGNLGDAFIKTNQKYGQASSVLRTLQKADPSKFTTDTGALDVNRLRGSVIKHYKDLGERVPFKEVDKIVDAITRGSGDLAKKDVTRASRVQVPIIGSIPYKAPTFVGDPIQHSPRNVARTAVPMVGRIQDELEKE